LKAQVDELALDQVMQLQKQPVRSAERMVACSEGGLQQLTDWLAVGPSLSLSS